MVAVIQSNVNLAKRAVLEASVRIVDFDAPAPHSSALKNAIMTRLECIPANSRLNLDLLIGKYVP